MRYITLSAVILLFASCESSEEIKPIDLYSNIPAEMESVLEAHGGIENWKNLKAMNYTFNRGDKNEIHKIALEDRRTRIEGDQWVIGFDGDEVWVSPDKETYGGNSARFYHNLLFYFYAMPFVLSDPGINYEVLEPKEIMGKTYERISIKYNSGVGDAPEDEYILCYDPESKRMEWLFYTVTYFSQEPGSNYNALNYTTWKETEGILLPETMTGYKTSGDTIAEKRYSNTFTDVVLSKEAFDSSIFEMPEEAEIDSLIQ